MGKIREWLIFFGLYPENYEVYGINENQKKEIREVIKGNRLIITQDIRDAIAWMEKRHAT